VTAVIDFLYDIPYHASRQERLLVALIYSVLRTGR
jgi:hypothetical protein